MHVHETARLQIPNNIWLDVCGEALMGTDAIWQCLQQIVGEVGLPMIFVAHRQLVIEIQHSRARCRMRGNTVDGPAAMRGLDSDVGVCRSLGSSLLEIYNTFLFLSAKNMK